MRCKHGNLRRLVLRTLTKEQAASGYYHVPAGTMRWLLGAAITTHQDPTE